MRLLIALAVSMMMAFPALAAQKSKFNGRLLTYAQLMSLSKEKRKAYVRDMTELVVYMEAFNTKHEVADLQLLKQLKDQIAMLSPMLAVLPEAQAQTPIISELVRRGLGSGQKDNPYKDVPDAPGQILLCKPAFTGNEWTCGSVCTFDKVLLTCTAKPTGGILGFNKSCPKGETVEVPSYAGGGAKLCIPINSWNALRAARQDALKDGKGWVSPAEYNRLLVDGKGRDLLESMVNGADYDRAQADKNFVNSHLAQYPDTKPAKEDEPKNEEAKREEKKPDACEPIAMECADRTPKEIEDAREIFRKVESFEGVDGNICIAGGFPSKYADASQKKKGTCGVEAIKAKYKELAGGDCPKSARGSKSQALCNPALFCLGVNHENKFHNVSFCVEPGEDAHQSPSITDSCAKEYECMLEGKHWKNGKCREGKPIIDQPGFEKVKPVACETLQPENIAKNVKPLWDDLIKATEQMRDLWCNKSKPFKVLFCRECEIMNDKIYAMNKKATNSGCAPAVEPGKPDGKGDRLPVGNPSGVREKSKGTDI